MLFLSLERKVDRSTEIYPFNVNFLICSQLYSKGDFISFIYIVASPVK